MEKETKKPQNEIRCSSCGNKQYYIRVKSGQIVCRSCGFIEDLEDNESFKKRMEDKN